ncbi:MAG: hypothetical protein KGM98_03675 [Bacteroidota bacterium]|nr:hypothetical protein [Bacteroidota bacterium]
MELFRWQVRGYLEGWRQILHKLIAIAFKLETWNITEEVGKVLQGTEDKANEEKWGDFFWRSFGYGK